MDPTAFEMIYALKGKDCDDLESKYSTKKAYFDDLKHQNVSNIKQVANYNNHIIKCGYNCEKLFN